MKTSFLKQIIIILGVIFPLPISALSLPVPFTPQAPFADWRQPWQDACEETVIVMADAYYGGRSLNKWQARQEILHAFAMKEALFGKSLDENARTMQEWINGFYPWEVEIVTYPTVEQIQHEIDQRRPVIALVHGRSLTNPYFWDGGPDYHTVIISGYDDERQEFITQEPGTRHGLDFRYPYDRIMTALHDFLPGNKTDEGTPSVLFTGPMTSVSAQTDADGDGLSKAQELQHKTVLWLKDSDGDGYTDGTEVNTGFLPTVNEAQFLKGSLVKSPEKPEIYLLSQVTKHHIVSESVFFAHGWQWGDVSIVSEKFLERLATGNPINT